MPTAKFLNLCLNESTLSLVTSIHKTIQNGKLIKLLKPAMPCDCVWYKKLPMPYSKMIFHKQFTFLSDKCMMSYLHLQCFIKYATLSGKSSSSLLKPNRRNYTFLSLPNLHPMVNLHHCRNIVFTFHTPIHTHGQCMVAS